MSESEQDATSGQPKGLGALGNLTPAQRLEEQAKTLASPRRDYSLGAKLLFLSLDLVYGKSRTLSKFKVLELVARVPYQSWEQVAYIAITHVSDRTKMARRIHERVLEARSQQDNEQWHLLILEELVEARGTREGFVRYVLLPQLIAFTYYQVSVLLYILNPAWSYRLNSDFEDHAEHEYMTLVAENPEWEKEPYNSTLAKEYGEYSSLADLFRQIAYDERMHKEESAARMTEPRFK